MLGEAWFAPPVRLVHDADCQRLFRRKFVRILSDRHPAVVRCKLYSCVGLDVIAPERGSYLILIESKLMSDQLSVAHKRRDHVASEPSLMGRLQGRAGEDQTRTPGAGSKRSIKRVESV